MSVGPRAVCIACWNVDLVTRVPCLPLPGETVLGDAFSSGPGGKGSNVAVGLARLGAQVSVVARLGDEATVKRYERHGERVRLLPANPEFAPIEVDLRREALVLEGLVVGVLRQLGGAA